MIKQLIFFEMGLKLNKNFISNYIKLTKSKLSNSFKESSLSEEKIINFGEHEICITARYLPPEASFQALKPLIESSEYPKNLIAIHMLEKTIQLMNPVLCLKLLPDLLDSLLVLWFNRPLKHSYSPSSSQLFDESYQDNWLAYTRLVFSYSKLS